MTIKMPPVINVGRSNAKDAFHDARFHYCFYLMVRALRKIKNKEVQNCLDLYSCQFYEGFASLRFPVSLRESALPERIQIKNEPKDEEIK